MEKDTHKTTVSFLIEQIEGDLKRNVFAFFPKEKYNNIEPNVFMSYAHLGQHSGCHLDYANECEKATPEQYADLQKELEGLGYNLTILP